MICLFLFFLSFFNHAQIGATADALGGAGVAQSEAIDSAFLNPAALSFYTSLQLGSAVRYGKTRLGNVQQINAVVADSSEENAFAGSLAYRARNYSSLILAPYLNQEIEEKEFIVNTAFRWSSKISLGLRGYKVQTDVTNPSISQKQTTDQYNGDLGLVWVVGPRLTLGFLQNGWGSTKKNLIDPLGVQPLTKLGACFVLNPLVTFFGDLGFNYNQNPDKRLSQALGLTFTHMEYARLHLGGKIDERTREAAYTAGFQFYGPRLKIGYAYQKEVRQDLGEAHTIDISINL